MVNVAMSTKDSFDNEKPLRLWKFSKLMVVIGPLIIMILGSGIYFLYDIYSPQPKIEAHIAIISMTVLGTIFFFLIYLYFFFWHKKVWPHEILITKKEIVLKYKKLGTIKVPWNDIIDIKVIKPKNYPILIGLFVNKDAKKKFGTIVRRYEILRPPRWFIGDIYGEAVLELQRCYEEYKKQLQETVSSN